jgi:hypothetical protein
MLGVSAVAGLSWMQGRQINMAPGSYGVGRILCRKHHDDLDGLDVAGCSLFQNLRLATLGGGHIDDLSSPINGREIEKWLLKLICGAIASRNVSETGAIVRREWIDALFDRCPWPEDWAFYTITGQGVSDDRGAFNFAWGPGGDLLGLGIGAFGVVSMLTIAPPDNLPESALKRPAGLGFNVQRPDGSPPLTGMAAGQPIEFKFEWPKSTNPQQ